MWAYRVLNVLLMLVIWLVIPIQLVTTFVLGILVSVTFGLLLLPMSLIWMVFFLGPLLGLSWVWEKVPFLRVPVAILGIPLAFIGNTYASLMPSMGELDSRVSKLLLSELWPYSLDCWRLITTKAFPESPGAENFSRILTEVSQKNQAYLHYLESLGVTVSFASSQRDETEPIAENELDSELEKVEARVIQARAGLAAKRAELAAKLREIDDYINSLRPKGRADDTVGDNTDSNESVPPFYLWVESWLQTNADSPNIEDALDCYLEQYALPLSNQHEADDLAARRTKCEILETSLPHAKSTVRESIADHLRKSRQLLVLLEQREDGWARLDGYFTTTQASRAAANQRAHDDYSDELDKVNSEMEEIYVQMKAGTISPPVAIIKLDELEERLRRMEPGFQDE